MVKLFILQFNKIQNMLYYFRLYFLSIFFIFSLINNVFAIDINPPDWVLNRPTSLIDYIGIGIANKNNNDYIQIAKNNALKDLASEIKTTISGNSVLYQYEKDDTFNENFETYTKTTILEELEEYDVIDSWEDDNQFWIYYRLSKHKHKELKRIKLKKAKNLALDYFIKAKEYENTQEINSAIIFYSKSFDAISKFLNSDLSVYYNDDKIYLGNEIFNSITQIFSKIELSTKDNQLNVKVLSASKKPITIIAQYNFEDNLKPIKNLPLDFYFSKGKGVLSKNNKTNNAGIAFCNLSSITSREKQQEIIATINLKKYFIDKSILLVLLKEKNILPTVKINLTVTQLTAYFSSNNYYLDDPINKSNSTTRFLKNYLSKNFFVFTNQESEAAIKITVESNITEGNYIKGEMYDMIELFLEYNISIFNTETSKEVFSENLTNIKSLTNIENSTESNISKLNKIAIRKIKKQLLPKLDKLNL